MSMKNCSGSIWNRTRDLPAFSAVPQPTAPPRAPLILKEEFYFSSLTYSNFVDRRLSFLFSDQYFSICGAWGVIVVKAMRYYSDGSGIDSLWCHWIFQ
jgi:hypothetical protein